MTLPFRIFLFLTAQVCIAAAEVQHHNHRNVRVEKTDPDVDINGQEMPILDPDADTERILRCKSDTGKQLSRSADRQWIACCPPGQKLVGTAHTTFNCCEMSHEIIGSSEVGYSCCPVGHTYDGLVCHGPLSPDKQETPSKPSSPSGMIEGRCYELSFGNGLWLGFDDNENWYKAALPGSGHPVGRFKFCKSTTCSTDQSVAIDEFWLDSSRDGTPIGKTDSFDEAGQFLLKKSSNGYCLGSLNQGIDRAGSKEGSLTFLPGEQNEHTCLLFQVAEVSCKMQAKSIDEPFCPPPGTEEQPPGAVAEGPIGCLYWRASGSSSWQDRDIPRYVNNYYVLPVGNQPPHEGYTSGSATGGSGMGGSGTATGGSGSGGAASGGNHPRHDWAGGNNAGRCS
ncbi:cystein rich [Fusarium beomiforme]|uniref:Cystein rich n=1 Tax=Fusarium beomiforme TaxID=44412 RepID=A0A9P5AMR1_9HYPO|nr:cystein rich [Fusarium beomiforme]